MKNAIIFLATVSLILPCWVASAAGGGYRGSQEEKVTEVQMKPFRIVLHEQTAEVFSKATVSFEKGGTHTIQIAGSTSVGTDVDLQREESSLRVMLGESMLLAQRVSWLNVPLQKNYPELIANLTLEKEDITQELDHLATVTRLEEEYVKRVDALAHGIAAVNSEKLLLDGEKALGTIDAVFKQRRATSEAQFNREQRKAKLMKRMTQIDAQIQEATETQRVAHAAISIDEAGELEITTSQLVLSASWKPHYELHFDTAKNKVQVYYNALVAQYTHQDWEDVLVELCTGVPTTDRIAPELKPMVAGLYAKETTGGGGGGGIFGGIQAEFALASHARMGPLRHQKAQNVVDVDAAKLGGEGDKEGRRAAAKPKAVLHVDKPVTVSTGVSDVFKLSTKNTVRGWQEVRLRITELHLDANLTYLTVPKLSTKVYIQAVITNKSPFAFLPGTALIFSDGTFVSHSSLPLIGCEGSSTVAVGVDPFLEVKRQLVSVVHHKDSHIFSADDLFRFFHYSVAVTSKKSSGIIVTIRDAVPTTTEEKLKIELLEPRYSEPLRGLKRDVGLAASKVKRTTLDTQGILTWERWVGAGETARIDLRYSAGWADGRNPYGFDDI